MHPRIEQALGDHIEGLSLMLERLNAQLAAVTRERDELRKQLDDRAAADGRRRRQQELPGQPAAE